MNRLLGLLIVLLFSTLFYQPAEAQNNPYKIDDKLYAYYQKCSSYVNKPVVLAMADTLFESATQTKDDKAQCLALHLKVDYYYYADSLEALLRENQNIADFARHTQHQQYIFSAWNRIISYYIQHHDSEQALRELKQYQDEALRLNNSYGIARSYIRMGELYQSLNNDLAITQFENAIDYYKNIGETKDISYPYNRLGYCYLNKKDLKTAEKYALQSLVSAQVAAHKISAYSILLKIYIEAHKFNKASLYKKLLDDLNAKKLLIGANKSSYIIGVTDYYIASKQWDKALVYVDSIENPIAQAEYQAKIFLEQKNFEKAYNYISLKNKLSDSIIQAANTEVLAAYNARFNNQTLEMEKNRLEVQHQQEELQRIALETREKQRNFIVLIIILLMTSGFSLVYAISRRRSAHRLQAEKQLAEEACRRAETADRLKTVFLQNISHEIRTPLNAIVGFNDLLNGNENIELEPEERAELLSSIHRNTELLLTLVNDVLDLSSLDSGNYQLSLNSTNIEELCRHTLTNMTAKVPTGVSLGLEASPTNLIITTDASCLQQILMNLLENACKYTEHGKIILSYKTDSEKVTFSVTDNGCGISPDNAEIIFQRYEKLDSFKPGFGIGLSICRSIATLLNGHIYLDTTYTQGARFVLEIPLLNNTLITM
ncbi:HAMP domain-containing sensor histidine kinase [Bacteroides sp.]|uniref:tetratricopeptide repeat-containing sensor histidine kinase n=1 Tax=Bacteroides sp. TaxID=29523 RepID=UPI0026243CEA|nr:HAMP domain-containing sensor histidine kinase [Bacteroides sp.]